jgi:hypothetical protein
MGDSTLLMERKRLRVSVCRRAGRNEYKFKLNAAAESTGSVFMSSSVIFLVLDFRHHHSNPPLPFE